MHSSSRGYQEDIAFYNVRFLKNIKSTNETKTIAADVSITNDVKKVIQSKIMKYDTISKINNLIFISTNGHASNKVINFITGICNNILEKQSQSQVYTLSQLIFYWWARLSATIHIVISEIISSCCSAMVHTPNGVFSAMDQCGHSHIINAFIV